MSSCHCVHQATKTKPPGRMQLLSNLWNWVQEHFYIFVYFYLYKLVDRKRFYSHRNGSLEGNALPKCPEIILPNQQQYPTTRGKITKQPFDKWFIFPTSIFTSLQPLYVQNYQSEAVLCFYQRWCQRKTCCITLLGKLLFQTIYGIW